MLAPNTGSQNVYIVFFQENIFAMILDLCACLSVVPPPQADASNRPIRPQIYDFYILKLNGLSSLITDPPPTSFTTLSQKERKKGDT